MSVEFPPDQLKAKGFIQTTDGWTHPSNVTGTPTEPVLTQDEPKVRKVRAMNKTETHYARLLESMQTRGEIVRFVYEGMRLRWNDMIYTPDFVVFPTAGKLRMIEVKGGHIFPQAKIRFKGCKNQWPEFDFEMWQKTKGEFTRIL